jgi:hypothetical protein
LSNLDKLPGLCKETGFFKINAKLGDNAYPSTGRKPQILQANIIAQPGLLQPPVSFFEDLCAQTSFAMVFLQQLIFAAAGNLITSPEKEERNKIQPIRMTANNLIVLINAKTAIFVLSLNHF